MPKIENTNCAIKARAAIAMSKANCRKTNRTMSFLNNKTLNNMNAEKIIEFYEKFIGKPISESFKQEIRKGKNRDYIIKNQELIKTITGKDIPDFFIKKTEQKLDKVG